MTYYYSKTSDLPFAEAVARTREALKEQGFGIITEIDVTNTFKQKLDLDFRPYMILGACNPKAAYEALLQEDKVGVMLPCNVIVQQRASGGGSEIAAVDPVASMSAIQNPGLQAKAEEIGASLRRALDAI
ncbi:DUF302 domain-containing protein [Brevundimonas sp. SL161]|uniref:DUF302 domain-containing protein n=1 Tax=Brevundimonas sp. SL161 TaxID=2804613 RepID=UPI003CEC2F43